MFHVEHFLYEDALDSELLILSQSLARVDFKLSPHQMRQFETYLNLLKSWSQRTNLVSGSDRTRLVSRHFLESVAVLFAFDIPAGALFLDLGTGAGLPGIPIKILRPDLKCVLLDSKRMKSLFLKKVVSDLVLENTEVVCDRVEKLDSSFAVAFDIVICRAVATLVELWEWAAPLLKKSGHLLAMKGGDLNTEIAAFQKKYNTVPLKLVAYPHTLVADEQKKIVVLHPDSLDLFN